LFSRTPPPATTPASSNPNLLIPVTNESNTKELGCMTLVTSTTTRASPLQNRTPQFLLTRKKKSEQKKQKKEQQQNQKQLRRFITKTP
jgi:hypothetical protein